MIDDCNIFFVVIVYCLCKVMKLTDPVVSAVISYVLKHSVCR